MRKLHRWTKPTGCLWELNTVHEQRYLRLARQWEDLNVTGLNVTFFYLVGVFSPDTPKTFDANGVSVCRWQRALSLLCLLCLEQVADAAQTDIYLAKKDAKIGE